MLAFGAGCGPASEGNNGTMPSELIEIDESITEDTTWEAGTYRVNPFNFTVEGATLTIEPCTTIQVDTKIRIETDGNIVAIGEPDCPITFTSAEDEPIAGDWEYLDITARADNGNAFEHVVFEYGGVDSDAAVKVNSGTAFRNVTVRDTTGLGIGHDAGKLFDFADITFESIPGHPVRLLASDVEVIDGVTTTDVQNDNIWVYGGNISVPTTWAPQTIPYRLDGSANKLNVNAELTIEAGTQLRMSSQGGIRVEDGGSLQVNGVQDNPVVIQSVKEPAAAADWDRINFVQNANPSALTWTTIRHGGREGLSAGVIKTDGVAVELNNVTFEDNHECDISDDDAVVTATDSPYSDC
jgi:hypothetical protein